MSPAPELVGEAVDLCKVGGRNGERTTGLLVVRYHAVPHKILNVKSDKISGSLGIPVFKKESRKVHSAYVPLFI